MINKNSSSKTNLLNKKLKWSFGNHYLDHDSLATFGGGKNSCGSHKRENENEDD